MGLVQKALRAGYDFLLLRCASGEINHEIGDWWTEFMAADGPEREALINRKPAEEQPLPRKRRRRGGRNREKSNAESTG